MSDAWYYESFSKPVGPISLSELKALLGKMKDWREKLVWNATFSEWRQAGSIPELEIVETPSPPPIPTKATKDKGRWLSRIAYVIAFVVVGSLTKAIVHDLLHTSNDLTNDAKLEQGLDLAASQIKTPQQVDDITKLVAVKHSATKELTYVYTLDTQGHTIPDGFIVPLRREVALQVCKKMQNVLSLGVVLEYEYRDSNSIPIGRFSLNKNDCR